MTNSLLVSPSSAALSCSDCETAKSPALTMRKYCLCSSACPVARDRNAKDCVNTSGNGADSRPLYIPTTLGVGYSLTASMAPTRVASAVRYSMASVPNSSRLVTNTWLNGPLGKGTRRHSPLISSVRYSSSDEHQVLPEQ